MSEEIRAAAARVRIYNESPKGDLVNETWEHDGFRFGIYTVLNDLHTLAMLWIAENSQELEQPKGGA